jgi:hypothetical protein
MKKTWDILDIAIPANYALLLLNITNNIDRLRSSCLTWLKVSQTTAKRVILRHWREKDSSSFKDWYIALAETASYERLIYKMNGKLNIFSDIWGHFLSEIERENNL